MIDDIATQTETEMDLDFPSLWGVKLLNDDYTPMDFVMLILIQYFAQSPEDAHMITMKVHNEGEAIVGAYTKDIAYTKASIAERAALAYGHPLRLTPVAV